MRIILTGLIAWSAAICSAQAQPDSLWKIRELIERESVRQQVSTHVALAFADEESGLKNIVGDKHRKDPLSRAYGPFQLQARWHLLHGEPLLKLLRLDVNIKRGVSVIKRALLRSNGDTTIARLMYVCGRRFEKSCSRKRREQIQESWASVWERWRPRAVSVLSENTLCSVLAKTSATRRNARWPQRKSLTPSNVNLFRPGRAGAKFDAASRMGNL